MAREPVSSDAPVNVLLELLQISDTSVPIEVNVLDVLDHIELLNVVVDTIVAPTTKDLSTFTRSPVATLPHFICEGHTPSGPAVGIE